jgi:putative tryptophan/tyrosine transport system substrate-binding protein
MLLGGAAMPWPVAARAQQDGPVRRIGVLMAHSESDPEFQNYLSAFRQALRKLGWIEGRNIRIETRWGALDDAEARQQSAKELLALRPDLILTQNTPHSVESGGTTRHTVWPCCPIRPPPPTANSFIT